MKPINIMLTSAYGAFAAQGVTCSGQSTLSSDIDIASDGITTVLTALSNVNATVIFAWPTCFACDPPTGIRLPIGHPAIYSTIKLHNDIVRDSPPGANEHDSDLWLRPFSPTDDQDSSKCTLLDFMQIGGEIWTETTEIFLAGQAALEAYTRQERVVFWLGLSAICGKAWKNSIALANLAKCLRVDKHGQ